MDELDEIRRRIEDLERRVYGGVKHPRMPVDHRTNPSDLLRFFNIVCEDDEISMKWVVDENGGHEAVFVFPGGQFRFEEFVGKTTEKKDDERKWTYR